SRFALRTRADAAAAERSGERPTGGRPRLATQSPASGRAPPTRGTPQPPAAADRLAGWTDHSLDLPAHSFLAQRQHLSSEAIRSFPPPPGNCAMTARLWLLLLAAIPVLSLLLVSPSRAQETTPKLIEGTGPGWVELGEKDFKNVNCAEDTWTWKDGVAH